jgi:hypothetical protein
MTTQPEEGSSPAPQPPSPTIHEAEPVPGPSGAVWYGAELDFDAAVARRRVGLDVVVRGDDLAANRTLAAAIEAAVGPRTGPQKPHRRAGRHALPHFHQVSRNPLGHCFYETENPVKKARKRP